MEGFIQKGGVCSLADAGTMPINVYKFSTKSLLFQFFFAFLYLYRLVNVGEKIA